MGHEITHSKTMLDGQIVDILKLYDLLKNRESVEIPLESIKSPSRSSRSGFSASRLKNSDTSFPLIIDENRFLIDGRHRFFKLLDTGVSIANVKIATAKDILAVAVKDESELIKLIRE